MSDTEELRRYTMGQLEDLQGVGEAFDVTQEMTDLGLG